MIAKLTHGEPRKAHKPIATKFATGLLVLTSLLPLATGCGPEPDKGRHRQQDSSTQSEYVRARDSLGRERDSLKAVEDDRAYTVVHMRKQLESMGKKGELASKIIDLREHNAFLKLCIENMDSTIAMLAVAEVTAR